MLHNFKPFYRTFFVGIILMVFCNVLYSQEINTSYLTDIEHKLIQIGETDRICMSINDFEAGSSTIVNCEHNKFSKAFHINIAKAGETPYDVTLRSKESSIEVAENDFVVASFYIRCLESDNTGLGKIKAMIEQSPDWFGFGTWEGEFDLGWTYVTIIGKITKQLHNNHVILSIHLADRKQTLEIGGLTLHVIHNPENTIDQDKLKRAVSQPIHYKGMEPDAKWRKEANERIEQIRKKDIEIVFTNTKNKPIKNIDLKLELVNHEFGFGTFLGNISEAQKKEWGASKFNQYLTISKEYFNRYTVPLYWASWSQWGWPDKKFEESYKNGLEFSTHSGYSVRGHVPLWLSFDKSSFFKDCNSQPERIEQKIEEHLNFVFNHELINGKLSDWDLINEVYNNHEIIDILNGGEKNITNWFELAQQIDTTANFFINDFGILNQDKKHQQGYYELLQRMTDRNTPFDGFGMQAHINGAIPPETLLETYNRFSVFNKPIHITELDFIFDFPKDNARYMEDFLTASFSHPNLAAVIVWGFWKSAKGSWRPTFYFFDDDFNEQAVGKAWKRMTKEVWHTSINAKTNKEGRVDARGFKGVYTLNAELNNETVEMALRLSDIEHQFEVKESLIIRPEKAPLNNANLTKTVEAVVNSEGRFQLGINGSLNGNVFDWYTPNFTVDVDGVPAGKIFAFNQKTGVSNQSVSLSKGEHTISVSWEKFNAGNDSNAEFQLNQIYLIRVLQ